MPLATGTRLGAYEILAAIGAGGMGEVYQAHDTRLNRDVALKVLPEAFAADGDRVARFEREAKTLAALNHPNVAQIYDVGTSAGLYLAMEFVPGEDLAVRLRRGPLPVSEAIAAALQLTLALESAHDLGIVHRDLKPANIKVRDDGTVKVLDFGLAKALGAPGTEESALQDAANSPTLTNRATQMGLILGTAAYMAPEQARGRPVDRRADIWAFGCVLYEMLTARRAFQGEDISTTLAEVLKSDPVVSALPPDVPSGVRRLIERCLVKDPRRRLQSIGDARLDLEDAIAGRDSGPVAIAPPVVVDRSSRLPWTVAAIAIAALAVVVVWISPWRPAEPAPLVKLTAEIGADASLNSVGPPAVLSPDGQLMAFVATTAGGADRSTHLFVRRLDTLQAVKLEGTSGAVDPFFSPSGDWVGYFSGGSLRKVRTSGGPSVVLGPELAARGGTWLADDTIVYTPRATAGTGLHRVPTDGSGQPTPLGEFADGEVTQRWPQALPAGKGILYTGHTNVDNFENATLMVMPLSGGAPKVVHRGGYHGRYVASGHLLFIQAGTLFVMPFDLDALEPLGAPEPVVEGVSASTSTSGASYSVSDVGTLVYVPGDSVSGALPLSWVTRAGKVSPASSVPMDWASLEISPNGQQAAIQMTDGTQHDISIHDFTTDTTRRLTTMPTSETSPVWSPDGRFVVYASANDATPGPSRLYWQRADGAGPPTVLLESDQQLAPGGFTPDGTHLLYTLTVRPSPYDVDVMDLPIDRSDPNVMKAGVPRAFRSTPAAEGLPLVSPDGRWITYVSDEGSPGNFSIFVESYPGQGGRWQASTAAGFFPMWSRAKPELLYLGEFGTIMTVPYTADADTFRAGKTGPWSPTPLIPRSVLRSFALHPDGERMLGLAFDVTSAPVQRTVHVIFNLFDELRRLTGK